MNRVKSSLLAVGITLAMAFTFSCSSDDGDGDGGGGSSSETKTYVLKNVTGEQFTYEEGTDYVCGANGTLSEHSYSKTINYSISNNTMVWGSLWAYEDSDKLNFKGTANELTGTWTRTKSACGQICTNHNSDGICLEDRYGCNDDYNITKAVFTGTTVTITRDICRTDEVKVGEEDRNGWMVTKIIGCNIIEKTKRNDKVTQKINANDFEFSYNGKTCKVYELSKEQVESVCKKAWEEDEDNYKLSDVDDILYKDFEDCRKKNMPPDFYF